MNRTPTDNVPRRRLTLGGWVRRLAVDLTPLRASRDFRLLWSGELVSQIGSQITVVALFVQVYDLTHSSAAVGLIGLVQLVPMLARVDGSRTADRPARPARAAARRASRPGRGVGAAPRGRARRRTRRSCSSTARPR